jgi:lipoic acid synthetase
MNLPSNIKIKNFDRHKYLDTLKLIKAHSLNTVCVEANCPNRYYCFSNGTATFMILGKFCTRNCRYCNIENRKPVKVDSHEPERVALAIEKLNLKYVVITSVTRDDLEDKGVGHFIAVIKAIREKNMNCKIEVLIPDFQGNTSALKQLSQVFPEVINHNIETVKGLFKSLRPQGDYNLSLSLLKNIKKENNDTIVKSGLMVGLGETKRQIIKTLEDLRESTVDILTIGQYIAPSIGHAPVIKYYKNREFLNLKNIAKDMGFSEVVSGPLVRSSYQAKEAYEKLASNKNN